MKKFIITALIAVSLTATSFASDVNKVNYKTISNFNEEFANALNVEWTVKAEFSKATFTLDNQQYNAFYDRQGNSIGTSHPINIEALPTNAKRSFAKKFADYTVKEAIQFDSADEMCYYISAENDKQSVVLKVTDGLLSVYKKTNKN